MLYAVCLGPNEKGDNEGTLSTEELRPQGIAPGDIVKNLGECLGSL